MKRILTIFTFMIFSVFGYGQTILGSGPIINSVVITPIACNGGQTSATVYIDSTGAASYDLYLQNSGIWMQHPSYPVVDATGSLTINSLTAGTKRIIVEYPNGSGILDTLDFTISQPDAIISFNSHIDVDCFGGITGSITFQTYLGTQGYNYSVNGGPSVYSAVSDYTINNLSSGTYSIVITDTLGCAYTNNPVVINISQPSNPLSASSSTTNYSGFGVSCNGGNNGAASVSVSGGTPGYTYSWSNGGTTNTINSLSAGTYTCNVSDVNGCILTPTISVDIDEPSDIIPVGSSTIVTCKGGSDGTATVSVSGGVFPYNYLWSNGSTSQSINGLNAGTYSCTVTDANSCSKTIDIVVDEPPTSLDLSTDADDVTCNAGNDGSASIVVSGGFPPYTYLWSNLSTDTVISGLTTGNYTVIVTDSNNCSQNTTINVGQPNPITIPISFTDVSCNGGNDGIATANPSGGTAPYSYSWSNGPITAQNLGLTFGAYTVTVIDAENCPPVNATVIINEPAELQIFPDSTSVSCFGGNDGSVSVSVSGGTLSYTYLWSDGSTDTVISGLTPGFYSVTVTDANNCIQNEDIIVDEPLILDVSSISFTDVSCNSGNDGTATANPSGGTAPYDYVWSSGGSLQQETGLSAGTYIVTVTDAMNCVEVGNIIINEPITLSLFTDSDSLTCNAGNDGIASVLVSGGVAPYSYLWSNLSTDSTIIGLTSGIYTVTVTDSNNCIKEQDILVNEPLPIQIDIIATDVSCNGGTDAIATANVSGGTSPYTYSWPGGTTTPTSTGLSAGSYTVTVTDAVNCPSINSTIIINEPSVISVIDNVDSVSCYGGNDGQIILSVSGGNGNYTYLWSDTQVSQNAVGLVSGTYTVEILDSTNCQYNFQYNVYEPDLALEGIATVIDATCFGFSNGQITVTPIGGTPPYNYSWDNGQNSQPLTNLSIGTYTCTVTDYNGCIAYTTATVGEPLELSLVSTSSTPTSCYGYDDGAASVVPQGGTSPYTYVWSNSQTTQTAIGLSSGTYSVMVYDFNNCPVSTSIFVQQPVQVSATLGGYNPLCNGDSSGYININSTTGTTPPFTYVWSNGNSTISNQNLSAGTYFVTIYDGTGNNCSNTFYEILTEPSPITANISYSDISVNGAADGSISANVSGGTAPYTYMWIGPNNYASNSASINSLEDGVYTLTVIDAHNCSATFTQVLNEPDCEVTISGTYIEPVCYGDLGSVYWQNSGGFPPYSNTLTSSDGTVIINGAQYDYPNMPLELPPGVYSLVVTDASNCSDLWNIIVVEPHAVEVDLILTDALCYNTNDGTASAIVTGGNPAYFINWGGVDPNLLAAGNYNVEVTDTNGCSSGIINFTINEPLPLIIDSISTTLVSCTPGNDGTATIYGSGGVLPYSYEWLPTAQVLQTATGLSVGNYTCIVSDVNNCDATSSVDINSAPVLDISIQETLISCPNSNDGALSANIVSGTGPITYIWFNNSDPSVVISSDSIVSNLYAGSYGLTATDIYGCIDQGNISLSDPTNITFNLFANDLTSNGANNGFINTTSVNGGQAPYSYYWTGPNGYTAISQNINSLSAGTYTLTITDNNGCVTSQSSVINEPDCDVLITAMISQPECFGDNGNITWTNSGGGGSYMNTITNLNTNNVIYNQNNSSSVQLSEGDYALQITDQYGCADLVNIQIIAPDVLIADILTNDASCYGFNDGSVLITTQGGTTPHDIVWGGINPNALVAGTYSVILTDANNCTSLPPILSFSIGEPSDINVTTTINNNVSCIGGTDGSATVNVNGGNPPYIYNWSPSGNGHTVNSLDAGIHYVTVTDSSGCISGPTSVSITEPALDIDATFNLIDASCFGYADGIAEIVVIGGTAPYTYFWSNGFSMSQITNLIAGNYSCIVTDAKGCSDIFYTTINEPSEIIPNIQVTNTSCYGISDGMAMVSPSGGSGNYNILWFDNSMNNSISGLQIGSYNVTITDNNGCSTQQSPTVFDIGESDSLSLITGVISSPDCFGGSNGIVNVITNGGTAPYDYLWLDSLNNMMSTDSFATNLTAQVYHVTVTDANGCSGTASILLSSPEDIVPNITTTMPSCNGSSDGSATANASGGTAPYNYLWAGGPGSNTETITGINANTTYYLSIQDANGCLLQNFAVNIPEPDAISINFSLTDYNGFNVSCNDSSNAIIANSPSGGSAPYLFSSDGIYYSTDSVFTNISEGWFFNYVKDDNNCISVDSVNVTAPDYLDPNITIIDSILCSGDNDGTLASIPQGGVGAYTYFWPSTFAIGDIITGLSEGSYSVEVTDDNGCVSTETFFFGPNIEILTNIISTPVSCSGASDGFACIIPDGGDMPYTFNWSNGINNDTILGLSAGNYACIVTDSNGCTTSDTVSIVESLLNLSVNCLVSHVLCAGDSTGSAIAYATGGTLPYTYQWNDPNSQIGQLVNGLIADTFIVAVTDSALCTVFDTIIINEPLPLDIDIITNNISCYGAGDGTLIPLVTGGFAPYHYQWEGPDLYASNLDSIENLLLGLYILNITDSNGCKIQDTSIITEPTIITSDFSVLVPSCFGFSDGELDLSINGGISPYSVIFASGSYSTSGLINIPNLSAVSDTLYIYDDNGCEHLSYIDLVDPLELLIDSVIITNTTCFDYADGAISVNVLGGTIPYGYELIDNSNEIISTSQISLDLPAGLYEVNITDSNNCFATTTVLVEEPDQIEILQQSSCYGSILVEVLNASGNYQIFWEGDVSDSVFIDNLSVGEYNVTVIDDIGCFKVDSFEIIDFFNYNISQASCLTLNDGSIEMNNIHSLGSPYSLFVNGDLESDNIISSYTIDDLLSGDYLITFQDNNGCLFSENLFVDYVGGYNCINIPVVISPNNDGTNDVWNTVYDVEKEIQVTILNRWGIVEYYYRGNSLAFKWDGVNQNGDQLPSADYYYIIKFTDNTYSDITGVITLIR